MNNIDKLKIKIFSDGADKDGIIQMYQKPFIRGFTTNPTLMHKAGILDYEAFVLDVLSIVNDLPFSFEVFSDDFDEMYAQAHKIASWGSNVYVKIPITNTKGESSYNLIKKLADEGVRQNVTAIMTLDQVRKTVDALSSGPSAYVSVFAGRVADTGRDPVLMMKECVDILKPFSQLELIWASPRELLNIFQANDIGCHIITVTNDILKKLNLIEKDLHEYSLDTVKMFYNDAKKSGFTLRI